MTAVLTDLPLDEVPWSRRARQSAWRLVQTLRDPRRSIVSPLADLVFIYGSPIWALIITHVALHIPAINRDVFIGEDTTIVIFMSGLITFAHLLPVFLRSHLNPTIRRAHWRKVWIVPPVLVFALTVSWQVLLVAGIIAAFWDVYHTGQQNFGLGRIYDGRAGVAHEEDRRADRLLSHILYIGPIAAGASLMDHLTELDSFDQLNWKWLAHASSNAGQRLGAIRFVALAVMVAGTLWYVGRQRRLIKQGLSPSSHKVVLMTTSAVVQIAAWGLSSPLVAFAAVNLYHAAQYFALVWKVEGRATAQRFGARRKSTTVALGVLLVFAVPAAFGFAVNAIAAPPTFIAAVFLSVSLLHFWMDGFIWSVRAKTV